MRCIKLKKTKKALAAFLCLTMLFCFFAMNAFAATNDEINAWYGNCCTVQLTKNKTAKVTLRIRDMMGWKNSGKVHIMLTDENGNWLKEWDATGNSTFKLGADHKYYRIYVRRFYKKSNWWNNAWNFENEGKTVTWTIENPKNCNIW